MIIKLLHSLIVAMFAGAILTLTAVAFIPILPLATGGLLDLRPVLIHLAREISPTLAFWLIVSFWLLVHFFLTRYGLYKDGWEDEDGWGVLMTRYYGPDYRLSMENPDYCAVAVWEKSGWGDHQCRNKRKFGELCTIHERQRLRGIKLYIPEDKP